MNFKLLLR